MAGFKFYNMIKTILFDVDGVIIKLREKYFSEKLVQDLGMDLDEAAIAKFFKNEFLLCEVGKADLKQELEKQIPFWRYPGTVEELTDFWFSGEAELVPAVVTSIESIRNKGVKCYLSTNNEKYRVEYLWDIVGIKNFMDGYYSSAVIGFMKPQQEFWAEIHNRLGNPEKNTVLVWDNQKTMSDSAKNFGFNGEFYSDFESYQSTMKHYFQ